ncbi:MAG TPA: hypothetical protein QGH84_09665, partial [Rhodospirillales bacterium]|nr:hypothetical protein [Rhodospirillales bacterium]
MLEGFIEVMHRISLSLTVGPKPFGPKAQLRGHPQHYLYTVIMAQNRQRGKEGEAGGDDGIPYPKPDPRQIKTPGREAHFLPY